MNTTRCRWAGSLTLAALAVIGVAAAPAGLAQDDPCAWNVASMECMMSQSGGFPGSGFPSGPAQQGYQPGDLVIPATGGPPQVVVAPAPPGGPVVTAGGGPPVIPAGPPIG